MQKDIVFALKIEEADLDEIKLVDLASLLSDFSKALGKKDGVSFQSIHSGSIFMAAKTFESEKAEIIHNLSEAVRNRTSAIKGIEKTIEKYPNWGQASIVTKHINDEYSSAQRLHVINAPEKALSFTQKDRLRGRFLGVQEGLRSTDHCYLLLDNGKKQLCYVPPELSKQMNRLFRLDALIEVHGQAEYSYLDYKNIFLESFSVESFEVIENSSIAGWIKGFREAGSSGWSEMEDPVQQWLEERHA